MTFLVDANVLSDATKAAPSEVCIAWVRRHERELLVDPVILGEVRYGVPRPCALARRVEYRLRSARRLIDHGQHH